MISALEATAKGCGFGADEMPEDGVWCCLHEKSFIVYVCSRRMVSEVNCILINMLVKQGSGGEGENPLELIEAQKNKK